MLVMVVLILDAFVMRTSLSIFRSTGHIGRWWLLPCRHIPLRLFFVLRIGRGGTCKAHHSQTRCGNIVPSAKFTVRCRRIITMRRGSKLLHRVGSIRIIKTQSTARALLRRRTVIVRVCQFRHGRYVGRILFRKCPRGWGSFRPDIFPRHTMRL